MSEEKKKKNKIIGISIGILVVLLVVISSTYAYWQITRSQDGSNDIIAACLDIDMESVDGTFGINPAWPISDAEGYELEGYTFKVTNNCEEDVSYIIGMDSLEADGEYLSYDSIKISIDNNESVIYGKINDKIDHIEANDSYQIRESQKLNTAVVKGNTSNTHNVKVWISSESTLEDQGKVFSKNVDTGGQAIDNDKPIGKIVASGDISRTKQCSDPTYGDWSCENLVDHNNDVKYVLYNTGTLNIYGSGDIETFEIGKETYVPFMVKVMKDYAIYNNIEFTDMETMALDNLVSGLEYLMAAMSENDEVVKKISEGQLNSYQEFLTVGPQLIGEDNFNLLLSIKNKLSDFPKEINMNIENGITSIGNGMLKNTILNNVKISSSVKTIEEYAFGSSFVKNVKFEEGLETIGHLAFFQANIGTLELPDSLQTIKGDAFNYSKVTSIKLPNNDLFAELNDDSVFNNSTMRELIIPNLVTKIHGDAFKKVDFSNTIVKLYGPERIIEGLDLTQFKEVIWNYIGE